MPVVDYTTINGRIVSENRAGVKLDYVADSLGSTVALLDSTQAKTDTFTYWPYGEVRTRTGTTATPFQFVGTLGYYRDSTGRHYVKFRILRSDIGRWQTEDPYPPTRSDNLLVYVGNNPTTRIDPTGLADVKVNCNDPLSPNIRACTGDRLQSCIDFCGLVFPPSHVGSCCERVQILKIYVQVCSCEPNPITVPVPDGTACAKDATLAQNKADRLALAPTFRQEGHRGRRPYGLVAVLFGVGMVLPCSTSSRSMPVSTEFVPLPIIALKNVSFAVEVWHRPVGVKYNGLVHGHTFLVTASEPNKIRALNVRPPIFIKDTNGKAFMPFFTDLDQFTCDGKLIVRSDSNHILKPEYIKAPSRLALLADAGSRFGHPVAADWVWVDVLFGKPYLGSFHRAANATVDGVSAAAYERTFRENEAEVRWTVYLSRETRLPIRILEEVKEPGTTWFATLRSDYTQWARGPVIESSTFSTTAGQSERNSTTPPR